MSQECLTSLVRIGIRKPQRHILKPPPPPRMDGTIDEHDATIALSCRYWKLGIVGVTNRVSEVRLTTILSDVISARHVHGKQIAIVDLSTYRRDSVSSRLFADDNGFIHTHIPFRKGITVIPYFDSCVVFHDDRTREWQFAVEQCRLYRVDMTFYNY